MTYMVVVCSLQGSSIVLGQGGKKTIFCQIIKDQQSVSTANENILQELRPVCFYSIDSKHLQIVHGHFECTEACDVECESPGQILHIMTTQASLDKIGWELPP